MRYLPFAANNSYPLDMGQIGNLFYSTRIPCPERDQIKKADEKMNHVIILSKGQKLFSQFYFSTQILGRFYTVDVLTTIDGARSVRSPKKIYNDICAILDDSSKKGPSENPVANLTNVDRDTWTSARERLVALGNQDALDEIDGAMFAISLDDYSPGNDEDLVEQFLWGAGNNRWVDKSFSVIGKGSFSLKSDFWNSFTLKKVAENGKCGLNFEHAWGDGACVLGFFDKIHEHILEHSPLPADIEPLGSGEVNEVYFVLDDDLKTTISNAGKSYQEHIQDLVISYARVRIWCFLENRDR